MSVHLYFSLLPEALIASQLSPEEFGRHYAIGSSKKSRGQAMFIEIDPRFRAEAFHIDEAITRCVPHEDGSPKRSVYISVYRVLEHMDLSAMMSLYLTTLDGRTLQLKPSSKLPVDEECLHMYQEIVPVTPMVVSRLGPQAFFDQIVRNPISLVTLPAIVFTELQLGELAYDPERGLKEEVAFANRDHLRQCLTELKTKYASSKMVDRNHSAVVEYRTIKNGFFVGKDQNLKYYPMPSPEHLREDAYLWFRSANM